MIFVHIMILSHSDHSDHLGPPPDGAGTLPSLHPRRLLLSTHFFNARLRMAVGAADFPAAMRVFADMRAPEVPRVWRSDGRQSIIAKSRIIFEIIVHFPLHAQYKTISGRCEQ
jgi:hypothetical protein